MRLKQCLLLILSTLLVLNITHRIFFNFFTHSLPHGVYIRISGNPQRGSFAATCLTPEIAQYGIDRGYLAQGICDTGTVLVLKKIEGMPGDHFIFENNFLKLNGVSYLIMGKDSLGRELKIFYRQKEGLLGRGKYFLLSDFVENSWDGRYWGPVSIQFLLKPLLILDDRK